MVRFAWVLQYLPAVSKDGPTEFNLLPEIQRSDVGFELFQNIAPYSSDQYFKYSFVHLYYEGSYRYLYEGPFLNEQHSYVDPWKYDLSSAKPIFCPSIWLVQASSIYFWFDDFYLSVKCANGLLSRHLDSKKCRRSLGWRKKSRPLAQSKFLKPQERNISQGKRGEWEAAPGCISDTDSLVNKMQIRTVIAAMFRKENKNQNKTQQPTIAGTSESEILATSVNYLCKKKE